MNPIHAAALRRHGPLAAAVAVFLLFSLANLVWVQPLERRYATLVGRATRLGMAVDPERAPRAMSPAVMALFARNSLDSTAAQEQASSGQLTATLLEDMTRLASRNGLEVRIAEQGPMTEQPEAVQVRGHLRLVGPYRGLVGMLGDMVKAGRLYSVERFEVGRPEAGRQTIELWVLRDMLRLRRRESAP